MKIHYGIEDFPHLKYPIVTSGTFDGVHIGHQKILHRVNEIAKDKKGETVILTFWPHPRMVLNPNDDPIKLLSTFEEKAKLLKSYGIDHLVCLPFTDEFSKLSSKEFVEMILVDAIQAKKLVIGYDHRFGRNREGSFEFLAENAKNYGFEVEEIPKQDIDDIAISSSKIRKALKNGDITIANKYLGRSYSLEGKVVYGDQIGRKIGFPTANIEIGTNNKLIPADGAYAVNVIFNDQIYKGMLNIGYRPTINGQMKNIEVHIFEFEENIYDKNLTVSFVKQLREEVKFKTIDNLKDQLLKDKALALAVLKKLG